MSRVLKKIKQRLFHALEKQIAKPADIGEIDVVELMRNGEDDMVMITAEQPVLLLDQPAFDLDIGASGTYAVFTGIVPVPGKVAVGAALDMTAE